MKKLTIYIVMALLCLNFKTRAQLNKAHDVTLGGIQIGQALPDLTLTGLHNYKDANGKPTTTAKLADFKGKLILIDFWATWCSPCIAMFPKMDSLQKTFGDQLQILTVSYQTAQEILPFLTRLEQQKGEKFTLPLVTADKDLHQLFPHLTLPHYVWVNAEGLVTAITESKEVTAANIANALIGTTELRKKSDFTRAYDKTKPLLINGNGGDGANMLYHSLLTSYLEGLNSSYTITSASFKGPAKIVVSNNSLSSLYKMAHGGYNKHFGKSRLILNVSDESRLSTDKSGMDYMNWLKDGNGYCYELVLPPALKPQLFALMIKDLALLFPQYTSRTEKRMVKCLVLKRTSAIDKIKSNGGSSIHDISGMGFELRNGNLSFLIARMEMQFMQGYPYPIVNGTNYNAPVDVKIDAPIANLKKLNEQLSTYDLKFEVEDYLTDMLIIADSQKNFNAQ